MSGLYASRWAATPPADEVLQPSMESGLSASQWAKIPPDHTDAKVEGEIFGPRGMDTPPLMEQTQTEDEVPERLLESTETPAIPTEAGSNNREDVHIAEVAKIGSEEPVKDRADDPNVGTNSQEALPELVVNEVEKDANAEVEVVDVASTSPSKSRLEAPRLRKKISWRGKTCVVSIPNLDYDALDLTKPLSPGEVEARVKEFEEAGYNTYGFDMQAEDDLSDNPVYSKSIYPDESETRTAHRFESAKVNLPDLAKWTSYMDQLTEQKLAALGVGLSLEESSAAPSPSVSRQTSGQYPPLPFSPPLPSTSAGSFGRPGMIRSHSHTMSVTSPISPVPGPLGHMHRHSTFSGPLTFQQIQQAMQQPPANGVRGFATREQLAALQTNMGMRSTSPLNQFAPSGFNTTASPTQFSALRNDNIAFHSPASPLSQTNQVQAVGGYGKGGAENQWSMQNAFSHLIQQSSSPNGLIPNGLPMRSSPGLPQLPEEEEEEEEEGEIDEDEEADPAPGKQPEQAAYVPPQKRAELNANIAVPTPRGHRHNISAGLERDILESEQRHEIARQNYIVVEEESSAQTSQAEDSSARSTTGIEKDPLSQDYPVQETVSNHKKSASRFNVSAPAFKFNPGASFQPGGTAFTFGATQPKANGAPLGGHRRQTSSGTFNVAAPEFRPTGTSALPKSEFSFSSSGPSFSSTAPLSASLDAQEGRDVTAGTSIFGKVEIPEFVKPARRSKAIAIKKPDDAPRNASVSQSEVEDSEGRIAQSEERFKRQRNFGGSGDEIPQFAEPTPLPEPAPEYVLKSQQVESEPYLDSALVENALDKSNDDSESLVEEPKESVDDAFDHDFDLVYGDRDASDSKAVSHSHKRSISLSALAQPFEPRFPSNSSRKGPLRNERLATSQSELEEGELEADEPPPLSQPESRDASDLSQTEERGTTPVVLEAEEERRELAPPRLDDIVEAEPSFAEIDAVMRQLNEPDEDQSAREEASVSPLPSPGSHPMPGVTYLPGWTRSDAPSPSPRRPRPPFNSFADKSFTMPDRTDSRDRITNGWPQVNHLNKAAEVPTSDWSADFSVQDDDKLNQRSSVVDGHIDDLIVRALDRRLQPLEQSLLGIQNSLNKRPTSRDLVQKRSSSAIESDADDEDELSEEQRQRPISRGRDKKIDQIKIAVTEALREQSPQRRAPTSFDMQDLHSYLADMKASFARAAATSLELEDVRAVVEDAVGKQSDIMMPIAIDATEKEKAHRRQKSQLEARLNDTLASMLEEANLRRAAEEREAESRRMLQVAEDELRSMRDSSRADDSRITAAVREKDNLLHRLEQADESQRDMEEQIKNLEAEHAATHATLEEYRMSSSQWRQHIDQATKEREDLAAQVALLKQELEGNRESSDKQRQDIDGAIKERVAFENTIYGLRRQLEDSRESSDEQRQEIDQAMRDRHELENTIVELKREVEERRESSDQQREDIDRALKERVEHEDMIGRLKQELETSRDSSEQQRQDIDRNLKERIDLENVISGLELQLKESLESGNSMRHKLEELHADCAGVNDQLSSERSMWSTREEEYRARCASLEAQVAATMSSRSQLEEEVRDLRAGMKEASDATSTVDHLRTSNRTLEEMVRTLQMDLKEQHSLAERFERDFHDAKDSGRAEVHRVRISLETDVETANHQVNVVRSELESELSRVRGELEDVKIEAETTKSRHERVLEEETSAKREALRKVNLANSAALDEARQRHENSLQQLQADHKRSLSHVLEDRQRTEMFLNERLLLSDAKLELFQDKVLHLEEKLEVAKSAAQAAAMSAQSRAAPIAAPLRAITSQEKISPQALRESILVLQEQLQDREALIEKLQAQANTEGPAQAKSRQEEIAWLRELLANRSEELTDLINTLARPIYDRKAVRDTAIRIRANLQMEQQEKERFSQDAQSFPEQAMASLSNFATPKAAQLSTAFNKWRSSMESSSLKAAPQRSGGARSNTPSKASPPISIPPVFPSGLMTPPASNLRTTPSPEATASLPPPRLHSRPSSKGDTGSMSGPPKLQNRRPSTSSEAATTRLFRSTSYDQDAEDNKAHLQNFEESFEDDSLDDVPDNQPPAFRSLETELEDADNDGHIEETMA